MKLANVQHSLRNMEERVRPHPERGYPLLSDAWRFRPHGEILNSVVLPCARPYRGQEMGGAFTIGA